MHITRLSVQSNKKKERKLKNQKHAYFILFTSSLIVRVRYHTFQTKELSIIKYGKLLFPHSFTGKGLDAFGVSAFTCVLVRKKKSPRSNKGEFFCLKCSVSYAQCKLFSKQYAMICNIYTMIFRVQRFDDRKAKREVV